MRFLSVALAILVPGCALIDAAGDSQGAGISYTKSNIPDTTAMPRAAVVAELDGIPGLDVVVLAEGGDVIACTNVGAASFAVKNTSFSPYTTIGAFDLDADGKTEVIAAGPGVLDVLVPNMTAGGLSRIDLVAMTLDGTHTPRTLAAGQFANGSTTRSLVISYDTPEIQVIANPLGAPGPAPTFTTIFANMAPNDLVVGDVNDTEAGQELVIANGVEITTFAGPAFTRTEQSVGTGQATALAIGDFGSSAQLDVAWLHLAAGPGEIGMFYGSPTGLFDDGTRFGPGTVGDDLAADDFDGDGRLDLATLFTDDGGVRTIRIFLHTAAEGVFDQVEVAVDGSPTSFSTGDLDGDGKADFVLTPAKLGGVDLLLSR